MEHEVSKQQIEERASGRQQGRIPTSLGGGVGGALTDRSTDSCNYATERMEPLQRTAQAPLRERIAYRLQTSSIRVEGLLRIRQLLAEHPEFEQFLELQRLIDQHGV